VDLQPLLDAAHAEAKRWGVSATIERLLLQPLAELQDEQVTASIERCNVVWTAT
jgi:hypothetical protein